LSEFIVLELREAIEQGKYKSELLSGAVKTADSYCIRAIVIEICALIEDSSKLFYCLKLVSMLMSTA
jgi:hypothetical protein